MRNFFSRAARVVAAAGAAAAMAGCPAETGGMDQPADTGNRTSMDMMGVAGMGVAGMGGGDGDLCPANISNTALDSAPVEAKAWALCVKDSLKTAEFNGLSMGFCQAGEAVVETTNYGVRTALPMASSLLTGYEIAAQKMDGSQPPYLVQFKDTGMLLGDAANEPTRYMGMVKSKVAACTGMHLNK